MTATRNAPPPLRSPRRRESNAKGAYRNEEDGIPGSWSQGRPRRPAPLGRQRAGDGPPGRGPRRPLAHEPGSHSRRSRSVAGPEVGDRRAPTGSPHALANARPAPSASTLDLLFGSPLSTDGRWGNPHRAPHRCVVLRRTGTKEEPFSRLSGPIFEFTLPHTLRHGPYSAPGALSQNLQTRFPRGFPHAPDWNEPVTFGFIGRRRDSAGLRGGGFQADLARSDSAGIG
jgi:hypothetical protein